MVKWLRKNKWWVFGGLLPFSIWFINYFFPAKSNQPVIENKVSVNVQRDIRAEGGGDLYVTGKGNFYITKYGIPPEDYDKLAAELGITQSALKNFFKIMEKKQVPIENLDSTLRDIAKKFKNLQKRLSIFDSTDPEIIRLKRQAKEALNAGNFEKAEKFLEQAIQKDIDAAKQLNKNANERLLSAAETKAQIGTMKYFQLDYEGAIDFLREAIELWPSGYKPFKERAFLAVYLEYLGSAANETGYFTDAEKYLKRCIKLKMRILGIFGTDKGNIYGDIDNTPIKLSIVYLNQNKYSAAKPILERSLIFRAKSFGLKHLSLISPLNNLAIVYQEKGKVNEAEKLYKRSLTICENLFGSESISVAALLNNLSIIYQEKGKVNEAEKLHRRVLLIYKNALSPEYHPQLLSILNDLVLFDDGDDFLILKFGYKIQHVF